jgi:DtxR family manganese transport transcriptional regulator
MSETSASNEEARIHSRVRRQHQSEITQDYLEAIYRMKEESSSTRVTDIQEVFGVSHVTVIRTLARLRKAGLLIKKKGDLILTEEGQRIAIRAYRRHNLVKEFLLELGVSEATAAADTEGIEHHLSDETIEAIKRFLDQ